MPLFEFQCDDCGRWFEELMSGQGEEIACPECKSLNTRRQPSVFATRCSSTRNALPPCGRTGNGPFT
jgi:putative FmdB family regulatory protein